MRGGEGGDNVRCLLPATFFYCFMSQIGRMIPKLFQLGENNSKNERVTFFLRFKHKIQNYEPRGQAATLF